MSFSGAYLLVFQTCLAPCLADIGIVPGAQKLSAAREAGEHFQSFTNFQCIVKFRIWNTKPAITTVPHHFSSGRTKFLGYRAYTCLII